MLREELGIAPDAETEQLADAIRGGRRPFATPREPTNEPRLATAGAVAAGAAAPPLPSRPSIVVLAFVNLSGDASQDHFIDGLVEDITVALGRETWLFVIASPSAFALRDRTDEPREIAARLGVRYVLRGSVRMEGSRIRMVVQLADAFTGGHIWSDRFEDELDNVFAMNDRLMTRVAALIGPVGRNDSEALWMAGLALVRIAGEIDYGSSLIDRSLALNPNSSNAWTSSSLARIYLGDLERATDHFHRSQRLNPLDQLQHVHWNIVGLAHFAAGRFEDAADAADRALKVRLTYPAAPAGRAP